MSKRRGLGRGLEALIPSSEIEDGVAVGVARRRQILRVPIDEIRPNPEQPRQTFPSEALQELADSIRVHGVLQPLLVRELPDGYQLIAGERRLRAAALAGLREVPVVVHPGTGTDPEEGLELSLIENLQRADLNPVEEARAMRRLLDDFGLTQEGVADRLAKSRAAVANAVRLLNLPAAVISSVETGTISAGHARALLGLPTAAQQEAALARIFAERWSVRQTEDWVRSRLTGGQPRATRARKGVDPDTLALEAEFRRALGTKVVLTRLKQGGRLTIEFYSDDQLESLRLKLTGR